MVNSSVSNNDVFEYLQKLKDLLPVSPSWLSQQSRDTIERILKDNGLPPLGSDLSGAPLHSRPDFDAWFSNRSTEVSSPSPSSHPIFGTDTVTSTIGFNPSISEPSKGAPPQSDATDGVFGNIYDIYGNPVTEVVFGDIDPSLWIDDIYQPPTLGDPYDGVGPDGDYGTSTFPSGGTGDTFDEAWKNAFGGIFGGLGIGELIRSLIAKYTDATVTGGEVIRNQWDLSKIESANQFSAQQAEISRDWQEEMYAKYNSLSGKINQAELAGVNPMFAVTGSSVSPMSYGSSSPSGATVAGSGQKSSSDLLSSLSSLIGLKSLKSQIAKTDAETRQIDANTDISLRKLSYELSNLDSSTNLNLQKIIESATSIEKIKSDIGLNTAQSELFAEQVQYLVSQSNYINAIRDPDRRLKAAHALIAEWQERNKELFKGFEIGTDVFNTLSDIGIGIFNAKTGRIFAYK